MVVAPQSDAIFHYRMNPNEKERIDRLERSLNSRAHPREYSDSRAPMNRPETSTNPVWDGTDRVEDLIRKSHEAEDHAHSKLVKKILWGSVGFFVLALAFGLYTFFGGSNMVSASNIDIIVSGPTTVSGGQELPLEITLQNKNTTALEGATLTVEYPEGTRVAGDQKTPLTRQSIDIGTISARGEVKKSVKSVLFGEKDSIKNIKITLQYRISGTSAVYSKEKNYDIGISSSPVVVTTTYPSEVNSNQEFEIVLTVTSNTSELLHNVLVKAEYPFGFTYKSSTPKPSTNTDTWNLGDLASSDKQVIRIQGTMQGQDQEQRTFLFDTGVADDKQPNTIATSFMNLSNTLTIKKSALSLSVSLGGAVSQDFVASPGQKVPVSIVWSNNLNSKIVDAEIKVSLEGSALDRSSVVLSSGGFYKSVDNAIIWNKTVDSDFASLDPAQKGAVSFSLAPLASLPASTKNQKITLNVSFTGNQLSSGSTPQKISANASQSIKIGSQLGFTTRAVRSVGPFENSGPMPPKAEKETTYTIIWNATTPFNDITNAKVVTTLPPYVSWNNLVSPSSESLTYDPLTNTVTWNAGTIRAGTGYGSSPREVSFHVNFLPSLGQVGTAPILIEETGVSGTDTFTSQSINFTRPALTTRISTDPMYKEGDDVVAK